MYENKNKRREGFGNGERWCDTNAQILRICVGTCSYGLNKLKIFSFWDRYKKCVTMSSLFLSTSINVIFVQRFVSEQRSLTSQKIIPLFSTFCYYKYIYFHNVFNFYKQMPNNHNNSNDDYDDKKSSENFYFKLCS